jgi:hypothetical protein
VFDADQYLAVVRAAMEDRSWETRPRAVCRHLQPLRPGVTHWAARRGEVVTVHHRVDGMAWSTDVEVPPEPPDRLAEALLKLLDQGLDPRRIAAEKLWK